MIKLSVIAPMYNNEDHIRELHRNITDAIKDRIESYEIILVNDGSKDRSASVLNDIASTDEFVKVIHFEKNCGLTAAIWAGIRKSEGELIALIDADLQTDPRDIFRLMPFIERVDFVNGKRTHRKDAWIKKVCSRIRNGIQNWLTGDTIRDAGCPLKLMKREVADSFYLYNGMHQFLPTLAKMNGFSVIEVSVTHRKSKKHGGSKYGLYKRTFLGYKDAIMLGWIKKRVVRYRIKGE